MNIDSRPIIFCYGDLAAKNHVEEFCSSSLAAQPVSWSRRPTLPSQNVHVDPNFLPLNLASNENKSPINASSHPVIYAFICWNDAAYYAAVGKNHFDRWFNYLSSNNLTDWLVISITQKFKKPSSKNSILTRLRTDFAVNSIDCLIDLPADYETHPSGWNSLLAKLRNCILRAFSNTLDNREHRAQEFLKSRNEEGWNFMDYFLCQEELTSLYCCFSLYEEALECIDTAEHWLAIELASATEREPSDGVRPFYMNACETLVMTPNIVSTFADPVRVERVRRREANLFELWAHILSRQCALLQAIDRIAELPQRAVRVLRLVTKASGDLELMIPPSQLYFWTFIYCLQILDIFRRGTPGTLKPEYVGKLRRNFFISTRFFQHSQISSSGTSSTSNLFNDDDSICRSNFSEPSSVSLNFTRLEGLESLDLLEDASLETEGTFNILARSVFASVVADDCVKSGRVISQQQVLVGTSRWTVILWRRACECLARLGRYLGLWPNTNRASLTETPDSSNDLLLLTMLKALQSVTAGNEEYGSLSAGSSFGAQLAVAFVSSESFEEVYRKFASACIFFQYCSGAKRASLFVSLELADFYRDARKFVQAEFLYQRASWIFLKESWTELATYALLQQAFCQQVQWRTESADEPESSVFKRYVQTALLLSLTSTDSLEQCYDELSKRGSYADNLFGEGAIFEEESILPPWWPPDWWKEALSIITEHCARVSPALVKESSPLHHDCPPLTVCSLRPLLRLIGVDLEEANAYTGRQLVRIHLYLIGVRPMLARVHLVARSTATVDWTVPPLSVEQHDLQPATQAKFFNVDLTMEGNHDGSMTLPAYNGSHPTRDNVGRLLVSANPPKFKESMMRKLFSKASVKDRSSREFSRISAHRNHQKSDRKPPPRPTSIDFLGFRDRMDTPDNRSRLSVDSWQDGLALSPADYCHILRNDANTPTKGIPLSLDPSIRNHKKSLSISEVSGFLRSIGKEAFQGILNALTDKNQCPTVLTEVDEVHQNDVFFYPRCNSTHLCHLQLPPSATKPVDCQDDVLTLNPGNNYLILESTQCGFHLPREISVSIYKSTKSAAAYSPSFIFSSPIASDWFGPTWNSEILLGRLLPRIEQVVAIQRTDFNSPIDKVSADVVISMNQPLFLTVRVGTLAVPRRNTDGTRTRLVLNQVSRSVDSPVETTRGQQYVVVDEPEEVVGQPQETFDLGHLVLTPDEDMKLGDNNEFPPGMRLCPQQSFLFKPRPKSKFSVTLPCGRPYPLILNAINPLVFSARIVHFHRQFVLIQLRVHVRGLSCPVLGSVDETENPIHRNPFYYQKHLKFNLRSPKLMLKMLDEPEPLQPPLHPAVRRSTSVVEFPPASPVPFFTRKVSTDSSEIGNSVFFSGNSKNYVGASLSTTDEEINFPLETIPEGMPSTPEVIDESKGGPVEHPLVDPDRSEGVIAPGRPFTFSWAVKLSRFESFLHPIPKSNKVGVSAVFTVKVGTTFDKESTRMIRYSCNLVRPA